MHLNFLQALRRLPQGYAPVNALDQRAHKPQSDGPGWFEGRVV